MNPPGPSGASRGPGAGVLTDEQIAALRAAGWTVEPPKLKAAVFGSYANVQRYCRENGIAQGDCGDAWCGDVDVHLFHDGGYPPSPERYVTVVDADAVYRPERIARLRAELAALEPM